MGELRAIEGRRPRDEYSREAVAMLEDFLARARAGEYLTVGVVAVRVDNTTQTQCSDGEGLSALIGGLAILQYRLCAGTPLEPPDAG